MNPLTSPIRLVTALRGCAVLIACLLVWSGALAFDLQGHRGARGLAPENTVVGFKRALEVGVSSLEMDVVLSADGIAMVTHDRRLNPDLARDIKGRWLKDPEQLVSQLSVVELQSWDVGRINPARRYAAVFLDQVPVDGTRMPLLVQALYAVKQSGAFHVRVNAEAKLQPTDPSSTVDATVRAILAAADEQGLRQRLVLQSFDWRALELAQRIAPDVPLTYLSSQQPDFDTVSSGRWTLGRTPWAGRDVPGMVAGLGGKTWSPNHLDLNANTVQRAHALGLKVVPWAVNEVADMERLIAWGVDGLITDYPDRLRAVMTELNLPLPPARVR